MSGFWNRILARLSGEWASKLRLFFSGQIILQFLTAISGILLVRFMTKGDYAAFNIAFSIQSIMQTLVDAGYAASIVSIVGKRVDDDSVIFGYIEGALHLRKKISLGLTLIGGVVYFYLVRKQDYGLHNFFMNYIAIAFYVYSQKYVVYFAYFRVKGMMTELYSSQIYVFVFRLISIVVLWKIEGLSATAVLWLGSLQCALLGFLYERNIKRGIKLGQEQIKQSALELYRFVQPTMPGIIFYSLQGQISVLIISYFGKISSIADTSAVGRFSQLFFLMSAFTSVIVEPFIARLHEDRVPRMYTLVAFLYLAIAVSAVIFFGSFGKYALFILGENYSGLETPLVLSIAGACIGQLSIVFWAMNTARHWNYSMTHWLIIVLTIVVQLFLIRILNVSSVTGILYFQMYSGVISALVHFVVGYLGVFKVIKPRSST